MNKRISYIDVAKGLLILLVVYDHLPDVYMYLLKKTNPYISYLDELQWIFKLFFMPAFFCITGMCSNFKKDAKSFIISNFKSLIIPNILLGAIINMNVGLGAVILHGGSFWFLSSLFVAKIIYWLLYKIEPQKYFFRIVILSILVGAGFLLSDIPTKYDIWYFHYAFSLAIFIEIGILLKGLTKNLLIMSSLLYVLICVLLVLTGLHKPVVAMGFKCTIHEIPLYLLSATTGTCLVLQVSKWINYNKVLQYFGKESLLFYIFQFKVMFLLEQTFILLFKITDWLSVAFFVLSIYLITILLLSIISYAFRYKYLSYLLGKF